MRWRRRRQPPYTNRILVGDAFDIGDYTYGSPKVYSTWQGARLTIGRFCCITGEDVEIFLGDNHRTDWISMYPFPVFSEDWPEAGPIDGFYATKGDVVIGNDVWIGHRAMILSGVHIGDGAVIGARAVVARDVAPYSVVVGNPARRVRKRFDDPTIALLLKLRWWDWPVDAIRAHVRTLCSGDVAGLETLSAKIGRHTG